MIFNSLVFAIFLPIVLVVYYRLGLRGQNVWLLAASILFYGWWDWRFLGLLGLTTVMDFVVSNRIYDADTPTAKRRWLLASVVANLGVLATFKYFNFFIDSADAVLTSLGWNVATPTLRILLPVGISFYTFQEMSYTIDVYRGALKPTRSLLNFALFVSYFPQLVAGPIERATNLLPQIEQPRRVSGRDIREGVSLIFLGLFKKVAVADALAPFVDAHFTTPAAVSGASLLLGVYLFAIQIYCDFSGYSDIARGCSRLLGIDLMLNFRQPYFASSITEFWRRWHISLSTWLRDYLYIPLGGNRGGVVKTYRNLMLTMLLGGLWHGASWTFVVWGGLHGLYLAVHKFLLERHKPAADPSMAGQFLKIVGTFHLVCLAWVFFRADSFANAWTILTRIAAWSGGNFVFGGFDIIRIATLAGCLLLIDLAAERAGRVYDVASVRWPVRGLAYGFGCIVWLFLGGVDAQVPFIYFQF